METGTAFPLVILVLLIAAAVYVPRLYVKRALRRVVGIFREREAITPGQAITLESLGLGPFNPMERLVRLRDYRPYAVDILRKDGVLRQTAEGKWYLSEDALSRSPFRDDGQK